MRIRDEQIIDTTITPPVEQGMSEAKSLPIHQFPELSTLVISILVALPMATWMRFRGMAWRPTSEMAAAPIFVGVLLIGLAWLGIVPKSSLIEWLTRLACPAMLIPMLLRLDLYTGRKGYLAQAA